VIHTVTPEALNQATLAGQKLIDVRSSAEFAVGHIPGAMNVPMEQVEARREDIGHGAILLICEAGTRAMVVAGWLEGSQPVTVLDGGTAAWRKAGFPLVTCSPCRWTLERQVRLGAGLLVLVASILATLFNPRWVYLAMFIGVGLTFAGATNICGMAIVLARMPWNRAPSSTVTSVAKCDCHSPLVASTEVQQ
jgi:rhodanese-related sulfurtransferase